MPLSRLRLRLAIWFAVAFLLGLSLLDLTLYGYLRVEADRRLTRALKSVATELIQAVRLELAETPEAGLAAAAEEAFREWPAPPGAYVVVDSGGGILAEHGPSAWLAASRGAGLTLPVVDLASASRDPFRRLVAWSEPAPRFGVIVLGSAADIAEENASLAWWLALSTPLALLLGLGGGYVLSRRALLPVEDLGTAIAQVSPTSLEQRLTVNHPPDELDQLALQFNALLGRLEEAQLQNRQFLRQAAHQIRTPLALVMGEASLALQDPGGDRVAALRRIRLAADQMQRRVEELFLLAEARTGPPPPLDEAVELDGLALEAAEIMRGRASALGRRLELQEMAPAMTLGNSSLLREAVLELIENALRHGEAGSVVDLSVSDAGAEVRLTVANTGPPLDLEDVAGDPLAASGSHGLGLSIVQWIARLHGGRLETRAVGTSNHATLVLPKHLAA